MKLLLLLILLSFLTGCAGLAEFAEGFNKTYQGGRHMQQCMAVQVGGITHIQCY
jgi:hypothetical protein